MVRCLVAMLGLGGDVLEGFPLSRRVEALAEDVDVLDLATQRRREQQVVDFLLGGAALVGAGILSAILLETHRVDEVGAGEQGIERAALRVVVQVAGNESERELFAEISVDARGGGGLAFAALALGVAALAGEMVGQNEELAAAG